MLVRRRGKREEIGLGECGVGGIWGGSGVVSGEQMQWGHGGGEAAGEPCYSPQAPSCWTHEHPTSTIGRLQGTERPWLCSIGQLRAREEKARTARPCAAGACTGLITPYAAHEADRDPKRHRHGVWEAPATQGQLARVSYLV